MRADRIRENLERVREQIGAGVEVLAASLFYKYFDRPIERTAETAGDGQNVSFKNASSAQEGGAELEARLGTAKPKRSA